MQTTSGNRSGPLIQTVLFVPGLIVLPFTVALLFNAAAEAFFGDKEPMFQTMLGLVTGVVMACILAIGVPVIRRNDLRRIALTLLIALLVYDVLAFVFCVRPGPDLLGSESGHDPRSVVDRRF